MQPQHFLWVVGHLKNSSSAAVILSFPPNEADYNIKRNLEPEYDFHAANQVNSIMNILYLMNGWLQRVFNITFEQQASTVCPF